MPVTVTNPLAQFHLEGDPDDPDGVQAVATFFGEDGVQVEMRFDSPGFCGAIAEMLWECAVDLYEGQTDGIMSVVARKGEAPSEDEPLTVEQFLQIAERNDPDDPFTPDLQPPLGSTVDYPWNYHQLPDGSIGGYWRHAPWERLTDDPDRPPGGGDGS